MHLEYCDLDFIHGTLHVQGKPKWEFNQKTWEERVVPVPAELLAKLKARTRHKCGLVFPTRSGLPDDKWWGLCKRVAKRAELEPDGFWPHKFRSTYCTKLPRSGLDWATVQRLMGHKDMASTQRYLAPIQAQNKDLQAHLGNIFGTKPEAPKETPWEDEWAEFENAMTA